MKLNVPTVSHQGGKALAIYFKLFNYIEFTISYRKIAPINVNDKNIQNNLLV